MSVFESFRAARWIRTVNLVVQGVLFLTLFAGVNYLAENHGWQDDPWRIDLTRARRYSLSPETLAYLKALANPVRIVVSEAEDAAKPDLRGLLREYVYATESNQNARVSVEYLDIDLHRREAQQLRLDQPNMILLLSGDNRRAFSTGELYRLRQGRPEAFDGEAVLTGWVLDVSNPAPKKIYFLKGHGELQPDVGPVRGLSAACDLLAQRNFKVDTLDLAAAGAVPADASLLLAVSPRGPYGPREEEMLRRYLAEKEGRMVLFAAPGARLGLDALLADWAVVLDDDLVRDSGRDNLTEDGDLIVTEFRAHPVTQALLGSSSRPRLRMGPARSVHADAPRAAASGLDVVTVAATSQTAWGEAHPEARRGNREYDPRVDLRPLPGAEPAGRLGLVVASSRAAARDNLPFSVRNGRLVVIGSGDLIDNERIDHEGVLDLLRGAVNWTVDRDGELGIPARPLDRFQLSLSARELQNLRYSLMFVVPGIAALMGLMVYWTRRT